MTYKIMATTSIEGSEKEERFIYELARKEKERKKVEKFVQRAEAAQRHRKGGSWV